MVTVKTKKAVIFIKTDDETKTEFLKNVERVCMTQNKVGEMLVKNWNKKINRHFEKNPQFVTD
jgi:hypothetical protein